MKNIFKSQQRLDDINASIDWMREIGADDPFTEPSQWMIHLQVSKKIIETFLRIAKEGF